ncbi:MAG: ArsR/SmtB family transcription factor [Acidimicrobiales bacterium]
MVDQTPTLDRVFGALSDPTRRRMVERLSGGPASVSELAEPLAMSLAGALQHVQVLEASGLVRSEKVGRVRVCRVDPAALQTVERWVADRQKVWERRFDRLGEYLGDDHHPTADRQEDHRPGPDRPDDRSTA